MSHTRKWFYVLEAEGKYAFKHGNVGISQYIGHFTSVEKARAHLANCGVELARSCPGFSRFSLTKERVDDPTNFYLVMTLDEDGDRVEYGWKKVE